MKLSSIHRRRHRIIQINHTLHLKETTHRQLIPMFNSSSRDIHLKHLPIRSHLPRTRCIQDKTTNHHHSIPKIRMFNNKHHILSPKHLRQSLLACPPTIPPQILHLFQRSNPLLSLPLNRRLIPPMLHLFHRQLQVQLTIQLRIQPMHPLLVLQRVQQKSLLLSPPSILLTNQHQSQHSNLHLCQPSALLHRWVRQIRRNPVNHHRNLKSQVKRQRCLKYPVVPLPLALRLHFHQKTLQ
jgi:hypothetical protein